MCSAFFSKLTAISAIFYRIPNDKRYNAVLYTYRWCISVEPRQNAQCSRASWVLWTIATISASGVQVYNGQSAVSHNWVNIVNIVNMLNVWAVWPHAVGMLLPDTPSWVQAGLPIAGLRKHLEGGRVTGVNGVLRIGWALARGLGESKLYDTVKRKMTWA